MPIGSLHITHAGDVSNVAAAVVLLTTISTVGCEDEFAASQSDE